MACTTVLVGKNASYDGSTMIARNDDSCTGHFTPKRFTVVHPEEQPKVYASVLSKVTVELPDHPMRYTAVPNVIPGKGIWAAAGVNEKNVGMTATETITTNARVLGADPLVEYRPAADGKPEKAGGIGEEDLVVLVLPYIKNAREGVERLGSLVGQYGTYEMNGIAFQDVNEIWWFESVGGHHWIARKVPDDAYAVMPNQLGIDRFDLKDALGKKKEHMCSADLADFVRVNHLNPAIDGGFNPRDVFGSHDDADHVYNTPRAWFMERYFNPRTSVWDGEEADFGPESDDIPWCRVPEKKITVEDIKYVLSSHFQGTPYDPYGNYGDAKRRGMYRPIGINRNDFLALIQLRPYMPEEHRAVEWLAFGSNAFNAFVPLFANIDRAPEYLADTDETVSTGSFYWASRLIAALADAHFSECQEHIERYRFAVQSRGHELMNKYDRLFPAAAGGKEPFAALCEKANQEIADMLKEETQSALDKVLFTATSLMKNSYGRSDN
ncbi:MAG TPA: C69 family dipeptidase [Lachnospiraceae bacterium]|nr:C69 family dipeptidase [Lachnospiraceae bacterium]